MRFKKNAPVHVVYQRCCGVDVHKDSVVACIIAGQDQMEIRTYGTMTQDLLALCEWLKSECVEMVAMESTASYWKPVFNLLEVEEIPAMLVNAKEVKNLPGRKTDVADSEWLAGLVRHGLVHASLVPNRDQRELKELVRYRNSIVQERTREFNRMDKVLQGANIKLSSVASSLDTVSGMEMIRALVRGECNEKILASMAKGTMKKKREQLERALRGYIQPHQQQLLAAMLAHVEFLDNQVASLEQEIARRLFDQEDIIRRLQEIPGVAEQSARVIVAEVGTDMSKFPSSGHLASWAGMTPAKNESAGKRKKGHKRKGNQTLRTSLTQCAHAASRAKGTYLSSLYARIATRRNSSVAAVAVARTILEAYYYMVRDNTPYRDLGSGYFDQLNKERIKNRSVKRLEALGYTVTLEVNTA